MPDRSTTRIAVGTLVSALTASAIAVAVPTTQVGARNAMLVPADARAAGLPASLREVFEPDFNERIWLCDAKGTSEVMAGASPVTYVANTEQFARGVVTELGQDVSVFATPAAAQAVFQQVISRARSCKGTVVATEGDEWATPAAARRRITRAVGRRPRRASRAAMALHRSPPMARRPCGPRR